MHITAKMLKKLEMEEKTRATQGETTGGARNGKVPLHGFKTQRLCTVTLVSFSQQAPAAALAQSVLAEVPNQLVSYFKMRGFEPMKQQDAPKA